MAQCRSPFSMPEGIWIIVKAFQQRLQSRFLKDYVLAVALMYHLTKIKRGFTNALL